MSDQQDNPEIAPLTQVSADLTRSIHRCRALIDDCRSKLAANSNERSNFDNDDEEQAQEGDRA